VGSGFWLQTEKAKSIRLKGVGFGHLLECRTGRICYLSLPKTSSAQYSGLSAGTILGADFSAPTPKRDLLCG
jgi:hypothetical protein